MESLESKLDRLTPEQHREVEDFVDFLIHRAEGIRITVQLAHNPSPSPKSIAPPLIASDPASFESPVREASDRRVLSEPILDTESHSAIHEVDGSENGENIDGYFDYSKFERAVPPRSSPQSPADIAIQNVKRKLVQKGEEVTKNKLLDWID